MEIIMDNRYLFKWAWQRTKGYRGGFILLLFFVIVISVFNVLNAASLKLILDIAGNNSDVPLWLGMILPIGVVFISSSINGLQHYWSTKIILGISSKIKKELLCHIEKIPLSEYNRYHTGDLLNRLSDDTTRASEIYPTNVLNLFIGAASCICAFIYAFSLSWKLTIIVIILAPLVVLWSKLLLPKMNLYISESRLEDSNVKAYSQDQLTDMITLKAFGSYEQSVKRFSLLYKAFMQKNLKKAVIEALLWQGGNFIGFLSFAVTVSYGAYLCLKGEVTIGTVVGYTQLLNYIIWPFTQAMGILGSIQGGLVSTNRIIELMNIEEEGYSKEIYLGEKEKSDIFTKLVFKNVSFAYEGKAEIIHNFSSVLSLGQLVGVGGESGQGKSTLLKLIMSLYQPTQGEIKLIHNGVEYHGLKIREFISYVPQEHMLFTGSIKDNICLGNENAGMEEIEAAAKKADIHDFIVSLDKGYDTMLDEKGGNISFGQAQRIAIARALLKDSPVILLDEPTASLDKASEEAVMNILQRESEKRLCIIVSHTVLDSNRYDKIIMFRDGTIYEEEYKVG
jgi:ABC-type multidrug transport system fused ATPase/permease subunit